MLIVLVDVQVVPDGASQFVEATEANASASRQEPGIIRFDVIQRLDDPNRFTLIEVYQDEAATTAHKETAHYATWRDAVAELMAVPRTSVKFSDVSFPV